MDTLPTEILCIVAKECRSLAPLLLTKSACKELFEGELFSKELKEVCDSADDAHNAVVVAARSMDDPDGSAVLSRLHLANLVMLERDETDGPLAFFKRAWTFALLDDLVGRRCHKALRTIHGYGYGVNDEWMEEAVVKGRIETLKWVVDRSRSDDIVQLLTGAACAALMKDDVAALEVLIAGYHVLQEDPDNSSDGQFVGLISDAILIHGYPSDPDLRRLVAERTPLAAIAWLTRKCLLHGVLQPLSWSWHRLKRVTVETLTPSAFACMISETAASNVEFVQDDQMAQGVVDAINIDRFVFASDLIMSHVADHAWTIRHLTTYKSTSSYKEAMAVWLLHFSTVTLAAKPFESVHDALHPSLMALLEAADGNDALAEPIYKACPSFASDFQVLMMCIAGKCQALFLRSLAAGAVTGRTDRLVAAAGATLRLDAEFRAPMWNALMSIQADGGGGGGVFGLLSDPAAALMFAEFTDTSCSIRTCMMKHGRLH